MFTALVVLALYLPVAIVTVLSTVEHYKFYATGTEITWWARIFNPIMYVRYASPDRRKVIWAFVIGWVFYCLFSVVGLISLICTVANYFLRQRGEAIHGKLTTRTHTEPQI